MSNGALDSLWPTRVTRPGLIRAVRRTGLVLYAVLGSAGALFFPLSTLFFGAALALVGGGVVALVARMCLDVGRLPHPALAAVVAGSAPAAASGSTLLGTWSAPIIALAVTHCAVRLGLWIGSTATVDPHPRDRCDSEPQDEEFLRRSLAAMPTEVLLDEWEASCRRLTAGTADPLWEVGFRDLLVSEFHARDPDGTACWLSEGSTKPPGRYIRQDSTLDS